MVSKETLQFFFKLLHQESGLILDESKAYLIKSRLEPLASEEGFDSLDALRRGVMGKANTLLRKKIADAMTTNETSFFRDMFPFTIVRETVIPHLLGVNQGTKKIRVWSAACSTGQEPYSLAMLFREMGSILDGWDIRILATDISETALKKAESGIYKPHEVQRGLSKHQLQRHFTQDGQTWRINPELRRLVRFRHLNLLSSIALVGQVDVVFCRNILIYFDLKTKQDVIDRMTDLLSPDGALFLGGSESLLGLKTSLVRVDGKRGGFYQQRGPMQDEEKKTVDGKKRVSVCRIST